ncbi:MAG: ribosome maturation factor RimP [Burkholderiaceae bacterium]|nr:ribosome maturation factor RimP [Burkholderiaceae bacterium]
MTLQQTVEQTVAGLGYELVEIERSAGGLLRVTIDLPWQGGAQHGQGDLDGGPDSESANGPLPAAADAEPAVTTDDCERVTRQLQYVLEVEGIDYKRLEVSSPGIDRLLRGERDFQRFAGAVIDIVLKEPIGSARMQAATPLAANRKKFRGLLECVEPGRWQIVWSDAPAPSPGRKEGKKASARRAAQPLQALGFTLDELREARLAPIVDFKGRKARSQPVFLDLNAAGTVLPD